MCSDLNDWAGAFEWLESLKTEENHDETAFIQSMPWRTSWQIAHDYGYNSAAPHHDMSVSALVARDATVRTCTKMKWTMVGRVVFVICTSLISVAPPVVAYVFALVSLHV